MDTIQKVLIKVGRKDLAQKYYKKIIAISDISSIDKLNKKLPKYKIKWQDNITRKVKTRDVFFNFENDKDSKNILVYLSPNASKGREPKAIINTEKKTIGVNENGEIKNTKSYSSESSMIDILKILAYKLYNQENRNYEEAERRLKNRDLWRD